MKHYFFLRLKSKLFYEWSRSDFPNGLMKCEIKKNTHYQYGLFFQFLSTMHTKLYNELKDKISVCFQISRIPSYQYYYLLTQSISGLCKTIVYITLGIHSANNIYLPLTTLSNYPFVVLCLFFNQFRTLYVEEGEIS